MHFLQEMERLQERWIVLLASQHPFLLVAPIFRIPRPGVLPLMALSFARLLEVQEHFALERERLQEHFALEMERQPLEIGRVV